MRRAIGEAHPLFRTWHRARTGLVSRARGKVGSIADAEDVVQDAALTAITRLPTLRDATRADAWVGRIVDRKATDARRASTRYARIREDLSEARHVAQWASALRCACVRAQARRLRPVYAEVLERIDERGESIAHFAATTGLTSNAATVRLSRARAMLRAELQRHCGTTDAGSCEDCGCLERGCCAAPEDSCGHAPPRT